MLNERQQALVDALRSGEYKQARCRLYIECEDGSVCNCCLGVAGILYNKAHPNNPVSLTHYDCTNKTNNAVQGKSYRMGSSPFYMDTRVMNYFGFNTDAGRYHVPTEDGYDICYLSNRNDKGATFAEIADIIEKNADTLFKKE